MIKIKFNEEYNNTIIFNKTDNRHNTFLYLVNVDNIHNYNINLSTFTKLFSN